jgi:hypothetical protein
MNAASRGTSLRAPPMPSRHQRDKATREKSARMPERIGRLIVWLHGNEMAALHARAEQEKRSEASLVREAVKRYLGLEGRGD